MEVGHSMETKILIAIDHSENALKAVDYVGKVMRCHADADISLLHVINEPSADLMPDEADREKYVQKMRAETLRFMEEIAQRLVAAGISEKHIHLKIQACKKALSIADLVLHEQRAEQYGTIVIGRRGMSKREEFLFGSVSNKVVREARGCSVWVVE
jgi:nucleotide-binding universal stress UspA family protein